MLFLIIPWNRGKNQIIYFEPVSKVSQTRSPYAWLLFQFFRNYVRTHTYVYRLGIISRHKYHFRHFDLLCFNLQELFYQLKHIFIFQCYLNYKVGNSRQYHTYQEFNSTLKFSHLYNKTNSYYNSCAYAHSK